MEKNENYLFYYQPLLLHITNNLKVFHRKNGSASAFDFSFMLRDMKTKAKYCFELKVNSTGNKGFDI